jgi:hypothetical protein
MQRISPDMFHVCMYTGTYACMYVGMYVRMYSTTMTSRVRGQYKLCIINYDKLSLISLCMRINYMNTVNPK